MQTRLSYDLNEPLRKQSGRGPFFWQVLWVVCFSYIVQLKESVLPPYIILRTLRTKYYPYLRTVHTPYVWLKVMWLSSSWRLLWSVAFMHEIASSTKMFNTASKCYIFMILREMNKGFLNVLYCSHYFSVKVSKYIFTSLSLFLNMFHWEWKTVILILNFLVTSKIIRENKSSSNLIHSKNFVKTIDWQNKMISRNFAFCCYKF